MSNRKLLINWNNIIRIFLRLFLLHAFSCKCQAHKNFLQCKIKERFCFGNHQIFAKPSVLLCTACELCQFWWKSFLMLHHLRKFKPFYSFIRDCWMSENRILVFDKCYRAINCFMSLVSGFSCLGVSATLPNMPYTIHNSENLISIQWWCAKSNPLNF